MTKIAFVSLSLLALVTFATPSQAAFHEVGRFKLGGDGGWDALTIDAESRRLYISRSDRIMVVDVDSGSLVGEVKGLEGAHAVVIDPNLAKGIASSGKTGELVAFDLKTLKITDRVKVGDNPDLVIYDPFSKRVFAFNGKGKSAVAVDPVSLKITATVSLPGKPEFAATDEAGRVFVNLEDKNEIGVINTQSMVLAKEYPLAPCEEPTGLSMDGKSKTLLVGCGNKLAAIVDSETGKPVETFTAGGGIDGAVLDPFRDTGFISAGEGLLTILKKTHGIYRLAQQLKTIKGARTIALDAKTGRVYLPSAQFEPAPPPATPGAHVRPKIIPGTFFVLVIGN